MQANTKKSITKERMKKFLSYYKPHKKIFIMDMSFAAVSSVCVLLFPLVSGYITAEVLGDWSQTTQNNLIIAGGALLALIVIRVISNIIYAYFGHAMGAKMEETMRNELFCHYERLSFFFHAKNAVGKLMTVISNDLTGMTELFHHGPEDIMMTAIKFIGAFVILININLPLTLIVFSLLPVLCIVAVKTDKLMEKGLLKMKGNLANMNESLEDSLSGIRTIKAFGEEERTANKFAGKNRKYTESKCHFYKVEAYFYEIVEAYPEFLTMLTVFFGALFIGNGSLDVPVLVTFLLYVGGLAQPIRTFLNFIKLYEEGKAGFIRFMDAIEEVPEIKDSENALEISSVKGNISFENLSFMYSDGTENVLENISLNINAGESVAFVGASGIGKTTVSMLIARFYDATNGRLLIDGVDIKDIKNTSLRKNIGIVQQEVFIFGGTIKDNIAYGSENPTKEEIVRAAELSNAAEFIDKLPNGYDSVVGTNGIKLSGGQRQRISLARIFLKNPPILILDEATSALDYESEVMVQSALDRLMKNRTSIVIAHRLSTVRNSDRIFVLKDKAICEEGNHDTLIKKNGEYAKLCKMAWEMPIE